MEYVRLGVSTDAVVTEFKLSYSLGPGLNLSLDSPVFHIYLPLVCAVRKGVVVDNVYI